jgi:uroporphyrinogen decarboxylase
MNKVERVLAAVQGQDVDHVPFSVWYHFGLQHARGERLAEAHIEFFNQYDLDFLKVMNDYAYPSPGGLTSIEKIEDWKHVSVLSGDEEGFGEQLKALRIIAQRLDREALFIETIFNPWTIMRRLSDTQTLLELKRKHSNLLLEVMEKIARSLANYARNAVNAGAAGIFLSLGAATRNILTYPEYEKFCRPFDLIVLDAIKDRTQFNVLHIHGEKIFFNELLDYPVQALNWSHLHNAPSFTEARKIYKGCLIGGVDEARFAHNTISAIERQVTQTIEMTGRRNLMIAPGCSIETDSAVKLIHALRDVVRRS